VSNAAVPLAIPAPGQPLLAARAAAAGAAALGCRRDPPV